MTVYEKSQKLLDDAARAAIIGRPYNPETDYAIILAAAAAVGNVEITPIAKALKANGIQWPAYFNNNTRAACVKLDMEILRAWKELGYWPKPR